MAERRDEGFLARWSRRKQAAREAGTEPEPQHSAPQAPTRAADADAAERPDAADRTPALPDPSTLDASSDFSVFLGREVPIETHRAALRRLWRLDPFYNHHDGLSDYCEDFTDQAKVVKGLRTAYKVGRGFLGQADKAAAHSDETPALQRPGDVSPKGSDHHATAPSVPPPEPAAPASLRDRGRKRSGRRPSTKV